MKARAAVILIQDDKIALIDRHRSGRHYLVFPGGKIKPGESPAQAAAREAWEELGLKVHIGLMVAEIWYQGAPQYYFQAHPLEGAFGSGTGKELTSRSDSDKGSFSPLWMAVDELSKQPVLPKIMAQFIQKAHHTAWPEQPLLITDQASDEAE